VSEPNLSELCKLTELGGIAYGGFQWPLPHGDEPGEWVRTSGVGPLCTSGWIHVYPNSLLAVALNPIHANFQKPCGWKIKVGGKQLDNHGLKMGVTECRLLRPMELPVIPTSAHVRWAVQLSLLHYADQGYVEWAERWLSGEDRTREAAEEARVASWAEETVAGLAARAAERAAWAATAAWAVAEARSAAERAAWSAARAAAGSAAWASWAADDILSITEILEQAIADETFEKEETDAT
jgi:hypothetical protein